MKLSKFDLMTLLQIVVIIVGSVLWIGMVYVLGHFITKYW